MRKVFLLILFALTACDHFPTETYEIGVAENISEQSIREICNDLAILAKDYELELKDSPNLNAYCWYNNEINGFPLTLGLRNLNDIVVVDIEAWNRTKEYNLLKESFINQFANKYESIQ